MTNNEVGHAFLARLGKKRLRPGGVVATNWLFEEACLDKDSKVLEVACNQCTTSIDLVHRYDCSVTAVDLDASALSKAYQAIHKAGLQDKITTLQANALKLPFPDNSFDVVLNEAMLTMLSYSAKEKALVEYRRVLKPGGRLLTHDVSFAKEETRQVIDDLRSAIHVKVEPLQLQEWKHLFQKSGFKQVHYNYGPMSLMSSVGMVKDEGLFNTIRIIYRGLQPENRKQFLSMKHFFTKIGKNLSYIVLSGVK